MLKNYFKIAWRNIIKNGFYSLVNIIGLSIGIAFTLLITAYVWGELQVNHQLKNADNQYILLSKWSDPDMGNEIACIAELPKALKDNYPDLVTNYYHADLINTNVSKNEKHFRESLQLGDSTLLNMYGFKLLQGDSATALNDPYSVVVSKKMAIKYFGQTDVLGQTLNFGSFSGQTHDFTITGVLDNIPKNSVTSLKDDNDFFFNAAAATYFKRNLTGWDNVGTIDYLELQKGADVKVVEKATKQLMNDYEKDDVIKKGLKPYLVKLTDFNLVANGGIIKKMTYTLSCIALFILVMAIVNFVNLCIGRSSTRLKEMGIRKALGGLRKQLVWQFLTESILMVVLSTVAALIIYVVARPYFMGVLGKEIIGLLSFPAYTGPALALFALVVGLLAGIYPALVLSALKSVEALKGRFTSVNESVLFRKILVAFQFVTAAVVFIGAVVVSQQIGLFFSGNIGYKKDRLIYAQLPRDWSPRGVQKMESIMYQLAQMPEISHITLSYEIPDGHNGGNYLVYRQGAKASGMITSTGLVTDNQYAATYHIPIKAGTFFKPYYKPADSLQIVMNETQAKALGWARPDEAVGQKIIIPAYSSSTAYTVCGVTADFHFGSMQQKIEPITFMNVNYATNYRFLSIKLAPGDLQKSLAAIQTKWGKLMAAAPFEYKFMDDALNQLYKTEVQLKKAAYLATALAIIIVLLGVVGLVSLSVQKRTKEIGIRKVLGSSAAGISILFLKDFLVLVLIAVAVACPIAWLLMQNWLNDYAYKIPLSFNPFVLSVIVLTGLTALVIIVQTIKAAFANPADSLRSGQ
jgi:ABC-type antimicrobial peptide transport system permease subunit